MILFQGLALAGAAPLPGTGCDADYWNVLGARASMEGKHDMEAAQVIITRPASVMDISCFEGQLVHLHNTADQLFSDNRTSGVLFKNPTYVGLDSYEPTFVMPFGPHPPGGAFSNQSLDNTLIRVIRTGLKRHLQNFTTVVLAAPPATVCSSMSLVWTIAKCEDFDDTTFWPFQQLAVMDPRVLLTPCNSQRGLWSAWRGVGATPLGTAFPPTVPLPPAAPPWPPGGMDTASTYLNMLTPVSCGAGIPSIPTGVIVDITGTFGGPYPDAVCSAPSCYYDPVSSTCRP